MADLPGAATSPNEPDSSICRCCQATFDFSHFDVGGLDWSPNSTQLVFTGMRRGESDSDIYVMDASGSSIQQLTDSPGLKTEVSWSPDGTKIAFDNAVDEEGSSIYVMDADGGNVRQLTDESRRRLDFDTSPAWSPDGTQIVFATHLAPGPRKRGHIDEDTGHIFVINTADGKVRQLTDAPGLVKHSSPSWSPDGNRIAFEGSDGSLWLGESDRHIYVMDADGGNVRQLTNEPGWNICPTWSPEGDQIAFQSNRGSEMAWRSMKPLATNAMPPPPDYDWEREGFEFGIFVMDADGDNVREMINVGSVSNGPVWSPSGDRIAFTRFLDDNYSYIHLHDNYAYIHVVDADGSNVQQLGNSPREDALLGSDSAQPSNLTSTPATSGSHGLRPWTAKPPTPEAAKTSKAKSEVQRRFEDLFKVDDVKQFGHEIFRIPESETYRVDFGFFGRGHYEHVSVNISGNSAWRPDGTLKPGIGLLLCFGYISRMVYNLGRDDLAIDGLLMEMCGRGEEIGETTDYRGQFGRYLASDEEARRLGHPHKTWWAELINNSENDRYVQTHVSFFGNKSHMSYVSTLALLDFMMDHLDVRSRGLLLVGLGMLGQTRGVGPYCSGSATFESLRDVLERMQLGIEAFLHTVNE